MSVNKHQPHIYVLPEDDANAQIADGFLTEPSVAPRKVLVLGNAGGWSRVRDCFVEDYLPGLKRYLQRHIVLVVDFDQTETRRSQFEKVIPQDVRDRVFVIGVWSEPEDLKQDFGGYEKLGRRLASDCRGDGDAGNAWNHALLQHNQPELERMRSTPAPIVFDA
ncbi:MAG: hypothetical protein AB1758_24525 [Candidatus Eremiobacterota bacterium]